MLYIKRFLKWVLISLLSLFLILSIVPYFFSNHLKEAPNKPFENSYFFSYNNTKFHFRLFVPKHIKHKALLIHGFSGSTFSFRNNIDSLINLHTLVVAMDMPAFGYSDKSEFANYSDSNKIQAIHFLLNHIDELSNHTKWNLIGHSMGGITIGEYASAYPQQTRSLIFIDGLPFKRAEHSFLQKLILYPPLLKWSDVILEHYFLNPSSFQKLLTSAYSAESDSLSYIGYMNPFKIKGSGSAIFRMGANYCYPSINDSIIDATPKLIIWGNKDQWVPIMSAFDYLKKPNTESLVIEDAGHCPMETHPQEVNRAIINFISKLE
ncbi:MAG TPA: alpha/beta hydrolase [Bacteroidia bacterium]|nr:alpha/beta hydrolase [Bacteroidia bacterium]